MTVKDILSVIDFSSKIIIWNYDESGNHEVILFEGKNIRKSEIPSELSERLIFSISDKFQYTTKCISIRIL